MRHAVIIDAVRTPIGRGKPTGALHDVHPVDLLATTLRALADRNNVDPNTIDDVIGGCVTQGGEQHANITRHAVLAAGFPETVPAVTVDRQCGSSQQAASFAAQGIIAGNYDIAIACGVESMSRVPMGSATMGMDPFGPTVASRYAPGLIPQGIAAELIASKWAISRDVVDELALMSHERAARAVNDGMFADEIVPVPMPETEPVAVDEGIRRDTSLDRLAALPPAFQAPEWEERFGELPWVVTAGNSSQISDGAAAILIAGEDVAERLGLRARARFHTMTVAADDPVMMLTGVIPATRKAIARAGLTASDIDVYEVNEAFASVVEAWRRDLEVDGERVNVHGGAMAIGHPLGASGARLLATLLNALEQRDGRFGLQTMCEAGGQANATIIERLA